jgi:hypothetical protein
LGENQGEGSRHFEEVPPGVRPAPTRMLSVVSVYSPPMLRHILILRARPTSTAEDIEGCRIALSDVVGVIPGLLDFHWGHNIGPEHRRGGFTHGFSMDFRDRASLDAYGPHPQHKLAAAKILATFEPVIVFDFEL